MTRPPEPTRREPTRSEPTPGHSPLRTSEAAEFLALSMAGLLAPGAGLARWLDRVEDAT
ncbi:MAG TPA: hypothetical protein PKD10_13520 [Paracoccaceae bacterium]|nr:hypothetical protein [Paracoccaceae bacterium]HMO73376.1 hypothetical protein [Paracoccaceae bacterium]